MISTNLAAIKGRIDEACGRSGRDPSAVRIMAVTKSVGPDEVKEAIENGLTWFGENKVQDARVKQAEGIFSEAKLSMIGHLQTNKASQAVRTFQEIHALDSIRLAKILAGHAQRYLGGQPLPVYIEVKTAEDPAKYGVAPSRALALAEAVSGLDYLKLEGLMTVAPGPGDEASARDAFRTLRLLRDQMVDQGVDSSLLGELSMGMSGDFEIAVEEGATVLRLGTCIFGSRGQIRR